MQHVLVVACSCQIASQLFYHTLPGQASYERFHILSVFRFSPLMTVGDSEILSQQKDVARPGFEPTSPFKKSAEVREVDPLASN